MMSMSCWPLTTTPDKPDVVSSQGRYYLGGELLRWMTTGRLPQGSQASTHCSLCMRCQQAAAPAPGFTKETGNTL